MPGPRSEKLQLELPPNLAPGDYQASLGLVDPRTRRAEIQLAIDLPNTNNRYYLGQLELE